MRENRAIELLKCLINTNLQKEQNKQKATIGAQFHLDTNKMFLIKMSDV